MMRRRLIVLLAGAAVSQRIDRARDYPTTVIEYDRDWRRRGPQEQEVEGAASPAVEGKTGGWRNISVRMSGSKSVNLTFRNGVVTASGVIAVLMTLRHVESDVGFGLFPRDWVQGRRYKRDDPVGDTVYFLRTNRALHVKTTRTKYVVVF